MKLDFRFFFIYVSLQELHWITPAKGFSSSGVVQGWKFHTKDSFLLSARNPSPDNYYYDDEYEDDYDDPRGRVKETDKEEGYTVPQTRYSKDPKRENVPKKPSVEDEYYPYDDDDEYDDKTIKRYNRPPEAAPKRYQDERYDKNDYYYDDEDDDDDYDNGKNIRSDDSRNRRTRAQDVDGGNFWSNPLGKMDSWDKANFVGNRRNGDNGNDAGGYYDDDDDVKERRKSRRASFKSGIPEAPPVVKDFYEKLFWSGLDPEYSEPVADKTIFGGTKGKFDGLSYLYDGVGRSGPPPPRKSPRGLPPVGKRRDDDYYDVEDYYDDDDDVDYDSSYDTYDDDARKQATPRRQKDDSTRITPPDDGVYPKPEEQSAYRGSTRGGRQQRRQKRQRDDYYDDDYDDDRRYENDFNRNNGDKIADTLSSWFGKNDDDDRDDPYSDQRSRRDQRRQESTRPPLNIFDSFFGVNRKEMNMQASLYDQNTGLNSRRSKRSPNDRRTDGRRQNDRSRRRAGYAYKYDPDEEEMMKRPDSDIRPTGAKSEGQKKQLEMYENDSEIDDDSAKEAKPRRKRERSWEERSLAMERIPPANVPAWGPSGELGISARQQAMLDALEDVQTASQKLEKRIKKEELAKEDITILKVDAELQRRKLEERRGNRLTVERLRQIELEISDASIVLRRARKRVDMARDELEEVEERHWALLSLYDPNQAAELVDEALRELQLVEPAARLVDLPPTTTAETKMADTSRQQQQPIQPSFVEKVNVSKPIDTPKEP